MAGGALLLAVAATRPVHENQEQSGLAPFLDGVFPKQALSPYGFRQTYLELGLPDDQYTKVVPLPGTDRLVIVGKNGKIWSFDDDPNVSEKQLLLDITDHLAIESEAGISGFAFHPSFDDENSPHFREVFLFYTHMETESLPIYDRLSRFRFSNDLSAIVESSEEILIQQYDRSYTHNSGEIFFDEEGLLYLTLGDEGNADGWWNNNPQHIDQRLFSGILRIDVDNDPTRSHPIRRSPIPPNNTPRLFLPNITQGYSIPNDNPWVNESGAYLEEFAVIGLRNPYSAFLDTLTDKIWVADVGDQTREELNLLELGDNGQWPYLEGTLEKPNGFKPDVILGTERPPLYEYGRDQGSSVIAGLRYWGEKYPGLDGKFLFSDWISGNVWSYDDTSENPVETLFRGIPHIVDFFINKDGDIVVLQIRGQMHRLVESTRPDEAPRRLSATGAFSDLATLTPRDGVEPYSINSPLWSDGASKQRWISLPQDSVIRQENGAFVFPVGTVFIKHFQLDVAEDSVKRLETRFLVMGRDKRSYGLTYRWNAADTDAELVEQGELLKDTLMVDHPLARVSQVWDYPSRGQCLRCHNENSGYVLGFKKEQLDGPEGSETELERFAALGFFEEEVHSELSPMVSLDDSSALLETRIRSYLDANCSHCHQPGSGLNTFDARYSTELADQGILNASTKTQNSDEQNLIVAPGDLGRSELWRRDTSQTAIQMPPLARNVLDTAYLNQLEEWILGLEVLGAGHDELLPGNPLTVYPNPVVHGQFKVKCPDEISAIRLLDQSGRDITPQQRRVDTGLLEVQFNQGQEPGVYHLIAETKRGIYTSRVIKLN